MVGACWDTQQLTDEMWQSWMKQDLIMEYFKKEKEKGMRQPSELLEKKNLELEKEEVIFHRITNTNSNVVIPKMMPG